MDSEKVANALFNWLTGWSASWERIICRQYYEGVLTSRSFLGTFYETVNELLVVVRYRGISSRRMLY